MYFNNFEGKFEVLIDRNIQFSSGRPKIWDNSGHFCRGSLRNPNSKHIFDIIKALEFSDF
jgi:hypothetical protein